MTDMNRSAVERLEPTLVWELFAGIASVPRPSKRETKIRKHIRDVVEAKGFAVREDDRGNLVVQVPASAGNASAPITVLQGHLDMVCEKNSGTVHDFDREPIRLMVDRDATDGAPIVRAEGTTLGADNGIGVAMALAAAFSPDVVHGPLELLFTLDEEDGMTGAKALTPRSFAGRRLLNLDSEEDDTLTIGCAGGCDTNLAWSFPIQAIAPGVEAVRVMVRGLRGGHSGCDIHENRGSAIKLLAWTLRRVGGRELQLGVIAGGSKRNAIPREASAVVAGPRGTMEALLQAAGGIRDEAVQASAESGVAIDVEPVALAAAPPVMSAVDTSCLIDVLCALPHGVLGMNPAVPGLVQTSNNVALVHSASGAGGRLLDVEVGCLSRSSSAAWQNATCEQIAAVGRLSAAKVETGNEYPGWEPNPDSALLGVCRRVYERHFGAPPKVAAIHAGLECGIIGERVGDMDMVSLGPLIQGAHSPDERVYVGSVQKSWQYLVAVLAELARG